MNYTAQARRMRFDSTIQRIPDGENPDAREDVLKNVKCSPLYPLDHQEKERNNMATTVRGFRVFILADANQITTLQERRLRFILNDGGDYRIALTTPQPRGRVVELLLEEEA